jgi:hypothetical protein
MVVRLVNLLHLLLFVVTAGAGTDDVQQIVFPVYVVFSCPEVDKHILLGVKSLLVLNVPSSAIIPVKTVGIGPDEKFANRLIASW